MLSPRRHAVLIATAIALAGFFAAVSSSIAATTIGSDLVAAPNGAVACGASPDCTYAQSALPGAQLTATSPGVIVRWRLKTSAAGGGPLKLRVLRSAGLNTFLGVSTSGSENATAAGINTFATRISIVAGDQIGIDQTAAGSSIQYARTGAGGASSYFRNPAVPDGSALVASVVNAGIEFLINADIEADGDVDGFGDETQDACPALAGQEAGCPPATVVQVTASKRQSLRKLKLSVVSSNAGTLTARAVASTKLKRLKKYRGTLLTSSLTPTAPSILKPKFSRKIQKILNRQISMRKKVTLKITVTVTDALGKAQAKTITVTLKR